MLCQGVQHVVEEANFGVDGDELRTGRLGGVLVEGLSERLGGLGRQLSAVEAEGDVEVRLICLAGDDGPPDLLIICRVHGCTWSGKK